MDAEKNTHSNEHRRNYRKSNSMGSYTRPNSFLYKRAYNALYKEGKDVGATLKDAKGKAKSLLTGKRDVTFKIRLGSCKFTNKKSAGEVHEKKYERNPFHKRSTLSPYEILRYPLGTEKARMCISENNTMVFIVNREANKSQIKNAFKQVFETEPVKVNTLITPLGLKKAYIKLDNSVKAEDIALNIGKQWDNFFTTISLCF